MTCGCITCILRCMENNEANNENERYLHVKHFPKKLLMKLNIAKAKTGRTIRSIVSEAVQDWLNERRKR